PVYLGEIRHKSQRHPGQHRPLVSHELWGRVQQQLRNHAVRQGEGRRTAAAPSPLAGKLFEKNGEPLYVQGAAKGDRRYRYYVSRALVRGESTGREKGWRVSAPELEQNVAAAAQGVLADRDALACAVEEAGIDANRLVGAFKSAQEWIERLRSQAAS